jgi:protein ImuB
MSAASTSATWLAIVLPRLNTDRLIRSGRAPESRPLAIYAKQANAFLLTGVDARASALGLRLAMSLADARAIHPDLETIEAEPEEDARALDNIAAWCERFTPVVVTDPPDGVFLDVTGCGHLFGGEEALRDQIVARLHAQGFASRAALAPTPGAAWALARYGPAGREQKLPAPLRGGAGGGGDGGAFAQSSANTPHPLLPPQGEKEALLPASLAPLPVEALRLDEDAAALLRRLGLKTIGQLLAAPRSSFAARAGERAMRRLDQALGRAPEPLSPRRPPPPVFALRRFLEPLFSVDALLEATQTLCADAVEKLELRGAGARRARLHLFGVDGRDRVIEIGVSRPEREAKALLRLFRERLNLAAENLDAEFGIEAARLDIVQLERIEGAGRALVAGEESQASAEKIAAIVDMLSARLGPKRVLRPRFNDAHAPERAGSWRSALGAGAPEGGGRRAAGDAVMRRPLTVFSRPQPIEAIATVPDGPPIRFRWRRVLREVARAEGPERISGDWLGGVPTRDYYRVEDRNGRRYWLYREGLYGEGEPPRWFVHGLFA